MRRVREFPLEKPRSFSVGLDRHENPIWVFKSEYERRQAIRLIKNDVFFTYEEIEIKFLSEIRNAECLNCGGNTVGKHRVYTPDFFFPETKVFVETKGKFDATTRTKMREVCEQSDCDIRMVFMRDNWLTRKHKMTYGRWCDINNIKWAVNDIPLDWCRK